MQSYLIPGVWVKKMVHGISNYWPRPSLRKNANALASKKRKGNKGLKADLSEFPRAWLSPYLKYRIKEGEDKIQLSSLDQATLDAIDEKTDTPDLK